MYVGLFSIWHGGPPCWANQWTNALLSLSFILHAHPTILQHAILQTGCWCLGTSWMQEIWIFCRKHQISVQLRTVCFQGITLTFKYVLVNFLKDIILQCFFPNVLKHYEVQGCDLSAQMMVYMYIFPFSPITLALELVLQMTVQWCSLTSTLLHHHP